MDCVALAKFMQILDKNVKCFNPTFPYMFIYLHTVNLLATGDSESSDLLSDVTSQLYKHVLDHGTEGVLQRIVWKDLKLSSRDGSRLVIRLERRGMIRRE